MPTTPTRAARVVFAFLLSAILLAAALLLPTGQASDDRGTSAEYPSEAAMDAGEARSGPTRPSPPEEQSPELVRAERDRIRAHLRSVEQKLEARDVAHLTEEKQEARRRQLQVLREYRQRGLFPRNTAFPDAKVPVFVDDRGVHCAVGYLMHRSGADSIVQRISESRNFARVPDLADEPGLSEWLTSVGLSLDEAAHIQPAYCGGGGIGFGPCPPPPTQTEPAEYPFSNYVLTSVGTGALNGAMTGINLIGVRDHASTPGRGWLGMASGAAGLGMGVWGLRHGESASTAGWVNVAHGAIGTISGYLALRRSREEMPGGYPSEGAETETDTATSLSISVAPSIAPDPRSGAGLSVRVRW